MRLLGAAPVFRLHLERLLATRLRRRRLRRGLRSLFRRGRGRVHLDCPGLGRAVFEIDCRRASAIGLAAAFGRERAGGNVVIDLVTRALLLNLRDQHRVGAHLAGFLVHQRDYVGGVWNDAGERNRPHLPHRGAGLAIERRDGASIVARGRILGHDARYEDLIGRQYFDSRPRRGCAPERDQRDQNRRQARVPRHRQGIQAHRQVRKRQSHSGASPRMRANFRLPPPFV